MQKDSKKNGIAIQMKAFFKNRILIQYIIIFFGLALFFIVKFGGLYWIDFLVEHQQFDVLSRILPVEDGNVSRTYFYGLAEQTLFGPLSQVIAAFIAIFFSLSFLKKVTAVHFTIAVFFFLLITKFEVLFFPPYGDAIGGPFAEAIWLAHNNFNYAGLLRQPDYALGGPRVYVFSLYPTYLAFWIKIIGRPEIVLAVLHQFVFWMMAGSVALLREIFRKVFSDDISILGSLIFLFFPIMQYQAESLNMETMNLLFIIMTAYYLVTKKNTAALICAVVSALVKGMGIFACGAVGVVLLKDFINDLSRKKFNYRSFFGMVFLALVPMALLIAKYIIHDAHISKNIIGLGKGWYWIRVSSIFHYFLTAFLFYVISLCVKRFRLDVKDSVVLIMYLFGLMFFSFFSFFSVVIPRYVISIFPFLIFCILHAVFLLVRPKFLRKAGLIGFIFFFAYGSYGAFYNKSFGYHNIFERSLEYRNDLYVNRELTKIVQEKYDSCEIVAPMLTAQMFALPELGYVSKDLDVTIYGFRGRYGGMKEFSGLNSLDRERAVFIARDWEMDLKSESGKLYPIHPSDFILEKISFGPRAAWIFRGGISIEAVYQAFIRLQT